MEKPTMSICDHPARSTRLQARILVLLILSLFARHVNSRRLSGHNFAA